ncbi:MAG: gamma-glutamyltransferase, partial [Thermoplasmataceae archaeon]
MRTRPNAFSGKAVVASSSLYASSAGAKVIEDGGNIFDAAIATSAALCVAQNNLCGLGGDMFALIRDSRGNIIDLNGSGKSFKALSIDFFKSKGMEEIPKRGEYSALTVPGIVRAWSDIYRKYCTLELRRLLEPAFRLASKGLYVTQNYSESISISSKFLSQYAGWKSQFMPSGNVPAPGTLFKQPDLAETIKLLISDGLESFYEGYLADRIIKGLNGTDVAMDEEDLKSHKSRISKPLSTEFNGYRIYETSPNSQGVTALLWLNILRSSGYTPESDPLSNPGQLIETGLIAYSERDRLITDPEMTKLPEGFLGQSYSDRLLEKSENVAYRKMKGTHQSDTTY